MSWKSLRACVATVVVMSYVLVLAVPGYAEGPSVRLIVNPNKTDVEVGSDPAALTAKASGSGLTFEWTLQGPGKIEGSGSAIFYHIPDSIDGKSAQAMITVKVTDEAGQETTETFTFNILAKEGAGEEPVTAADEKSAAADAEEKPGMSRTTKIAIGAGAAVALGAAIALAAGGDDDDDDGPPIEIGLWNMVFDWDCDGSVGNTTWNLKKDKTFTTPSADAYGTWEASGSQFNLRYTNGTTYEGTISSGGKYMTGTMRSYSGTPGCWNATYVGGSAKGSSFGSSEAADEAAGKAVTDE